MTTRELIDEIGGLSEVAHFGPDGDLQALERVQDVEPIMEEAKRAFNEGLVDRKSEFRRIASIPINVALLWAQIHKIEPAERAWKDPELLLRMANDPDLAAFRTLPGTY